MSVGPDGEERVIPAETETIDGEQGPGPSDCSTPGTSSSPEELEDLVEPLDVDALPPSRLAGDVVQASEGETFRVVSLRSEAGGTRVYEVAPGDDDTARLWLHEALAGPLSDRLLRQRDVLADVSSPMLPAVHASFEDGDRTCLVTEVIEGPTLREALSAGSLTHDEVLGVLAQVAFALTQLHEHGWVHLGVRPEAIMLSKPLKLVDLSFATRIGEKPAATFSHAGYSAPELLTAETVDARCDVYAVGALLFHAVNGKPIPETGPELLTWEPPEPLAGVPQVLLRCLGDPDTRYPTMAALHSDLVRLRKRGVPKVRHDVAGGTTVGLEASRRVNQDAWGHVTGRLQAEDSETAWSVLCVADGMGGMEAGEVASEAAVQAALSEAAARLTRAAQIDEETQFAEVRRWVHVANEAVCSRLEDRSATGGTTLVCALVVGRRLCIAHVGDSRLYLVRGTEAQLLTRDHSLPMALVLQQEITIDEIRTHPDRSKVTRSLGDRKPLPDYHVDTLEQARESRSLLLEPGDVVLACTDGLWEPVIEEEMANAIRHHGKNLEGAVTTLLDIALKRGAPDNATVGLLRLELPTGQEEE